MALLHDVREFMREQALSLVTRGRVTSGAENYVTPHGVRPSAHELRGSRREGIGMYSHLAEVAPETQLHLAAGRRVEWSAG